MARDGTLATDRSAERRRTGTDPGEQTVSRRTFLGDVRVGVETLRRGLRDGTVEAIHGANWPLCVRT